MRLIAGSLVLSIVSAFALQTDCLAQQYINPPSGYTYYDTSAQTARDEAIMRQEENNRKQKKLLDEMQSENDKKIEELKKQTKESLEQLKLSNTSSDAVVREQMSRLDRTEREIEKTREDSYKAIIQQGMDAAKDSELVLNDGFYVRNSKKLLERGLSPQEADTMNGLHKEFIYRTEKKALKGDPRAQYQMSLLYFAGHPNIRSLDEEAHKRTNDIINNKPADMSLRDHRKALVEAVRSTLSEGNDSVYEALTDSYVSKNAKKPEIDEKRIIKRNHGKALEWIELAANGGNETAKQMEGYIRSIASITEESPKQ